MNQHQVLKNRTFNSIEEIKHKLKQDESMEFFNDLLILQYIVPHLDKGILRGILKELKSLQRSMGRPMPQAPTFGKILHLLSQSSGNDPVLKDFLQCTGYSGPVEVPGS